VRRIRDAGATALSTRDTPGVSRLNVAHVEQVFG
jgi:hypothetical protein